MKPKIRKTFKRQRCCSKAKRKNAQLFGDCKRCCCLLSLFVSHLVVCNCSHSGIKSLPCSTHFLKHLKTESFSFDKDLENKSTTKHEKEEFKSLSDTSDSHSQGSKNYR